jgi:pimeloyl-ACP methyl ester carboxylesterase
MGKHRPSSSIYLEINRLRYHVRIWNEHAKDLLIFLHGHEDCSATFQFIVDELPDTWRIVAPDWRGHGKTEWSHESYLFQNYVADLDALIDQFAPDHPVKLLGHSMGGNAAGLYAGVRPQRIDRLVVLDAFGLREESATEFPDRLMQWMDGLRGRPPKRPSPDIAAFAQRLHVANPRLDEEKALFLSEALTVERPDGAVEAAFDPLQRGPRPVTYRFEDTAACFDRITAPVLWIGSGRRLNPDLVDGGIERRRKLIRNCKYVHVGNTGHNLHHDAPVEVASLTDAFFKGESLPPFDR